MYLRSGRTSIFRLDFPRSRHQSTWEMISGSTSRGVDEGETKKWNELNSGCYNKQWAMGVLILLGTSKTQCRIPFYCIVVLPRMRKLGLRAAPEFSDFPVSCVSSEQRKPLSRKPQEFIYCKNKRIYKDFPGDPVVETPCFYCRECVRSVFGELRSHMPCSVAKNLCLHLNYICI